MDVAISLPTQKDLKQQEAWIKDQIKKVGEKTLQKLAKAAADQRPLAYAPYSHYQVGAALLASSGQTYVGNNAERVSYSETDHAEESAITAAITGGEVKTSGRKFLTALAVSVKEPEGAAPCGRCRQIIAEHADNCLILLVDPNGNIASITSLKAILPFAFSPSHLGIK